MANILISPGKYVQGAGEMKRLGEYAEKYGKKALILITESGYKRIGNVVEESFAGKEVEVVFDYFNGECSKTEINRLTAIVKEKGCDMVIGIGGGKILDTSKAVAYYCGTPVLICPTIASTDAPCSALSVIYTDEGVFEEYLFLPANPNMVLMDTEIITKSPARLTVSGMGDALATYFEARACQTSGAISCAGGKVTSAAITLAELCFNTLMAEGVKAKLALEAGACTPAVEKVIEANTLLSGIGFESGGLAGAHAIHNGLTVLEECHHMYHGEKVAFGTLAQLVLENVSADEIRDIIEWCIELGLPVTLKELGVKEVTDEKIMAVAQAACAPADTLHNMPFEVTPETVCAAIKAADAYGRYFLGEYNLEE
ncbi:MAG: glycerol dehydrogenase [Schaedlerella sp.]|nr:glycerol dehydrogenase [Schaedlerella sp.]